MGQEKDQLLQELSEDLEAIHTKIDKSDDHAVFVIGVRYVENENKNDSVQTFVAAAGYYSVLGEGLFAEIKAQLDDGDASLFHVLRNVVRSLEEEFNISPDDEIDEPEEPYIH